MQNKKGLLIGMILAVVLPWGLTYVFLTILTDTTWMVVELDALGYIAVLSFESMAFTYSVLILGTGFWIPLFIWIITGLICGIVARNPWKGLFCTLIGLVANIVLFKVIFSFGVPASLMVNPLIEPLLTGTLVDFIITLGIFLAWYSLILPGGSLGGLFGGIISRFRKGK